MFNAPSCGSHSWVL